MMLDDLFETIDGQTALSREETIALIPSLSTRAQLNEIERINIHAARVWAMRPTVLRRTDLLTDTFARELHRRMFHRVWRWAGRYRTSERNLGWDPHRITEGVRVLFDDARYWIENKTYPLHESAVRLHHRLVAIHPWPNGNGRHARLMADVLVAARGGGDLTWGAHADLATAEAVRARYIAALQAADKNTIEPLIEFARS